MIPRQQRLTVGVNPADQPQDAAPSRAEQPAAAPGVTTEQQEDIPELPEEQFAYTVHNGSNLILPSAPQPGSEGYLAGAAADSDAAQPPLDSGGDPAEEVKTEQEPSAPGRPAQSEQASENPWVNLTSMFVPIKPEGPEVEVTPRTGSRPAQGSRDNWRAVRLLRAMVVVADILIAEEERLVIEADG